MTQQCQIERRLNLLKKTTKKKTFRQIKDNELPFGGNFALSGDFRQILPAVTNGTRAKEIDACLKSPNLWKSFERLKLRKNMKVLITGNQKAAEYSNRLLKIGEV